MRRLYFVDGVDVDVVAMVVYYMLLAMRGRSILIDILCE